MTEKNDNEEKKVKKLTLGGSGKLTLNRSNAFASKTVTKTVNRTGGSSVVVEVKRGTAQGGMNLQRNLAEENADDKNLNLRRLSALRRSQAEKGEEKEDKISTLSRLNEINQIPEKNTSESEDKTETEGEATTDTATDGTTAKTGVDVIKSSSQKIIKPLKEEVINSSNKVVDHYKKNSDDANIDEAKPESSKAKFTEPKKLKKLTLYICLKKIRTRSKPKQEVWLLLSVLEQKSVAKINHPR